MSNVFYIPKAIYTGPKGDRYLTNYHFMNMIGLAFVFHALAVILILLVPREPIITVPVHALNIKLGNNDGVVQQSATTIQAMAQPVGMPGDSVPVRAGVMDALDQSFTPPKPPEPAPAQPNANPPAGVNMGSAPHPNAIKHYVREGQMEQAGAVDQGSRLGNSTSENAEIMARYEQLISQWLQRHKVYPDEARAQRIEGKGIIRLRIDRKGRIKFFSLEKATGAPVLDNAIGKMVKASDPVPAVPANYPAGALLEFLIPVSFSVVE